MATSYRLAPFSSFQPWTADIFPETQRKGSYQDAKPERWKAWLWRLQFPGVLSALLTNSFLLASFVSGEQNSVVLGKKTVQTWDFRWFNFVHLHPILQFLTLRISAWFKTRLSAHTQPRPASVSTMRWRKSAPTVSKSVVKK